LSHDFFRGGFTGGPHEIAQQQHRPGRAIRLISRHIGRGSAT